MNLISGEGGRLIGACVAGASLLAFMAGGASAQAAGGCAATPACVNVPTFAANVTDLRTSVVGYDRAVTVNLRVRNRAARPLILGYVSQSGVITDDQSNRYTVSDASGVRGMGIITAYDFDPKFVLQAGEEADVRLEFLGRPSREQILGTIFQLDVALREIQPVAGEQFRLGREHALHFGALQPAGVVAAAATAAAVPATVAAGAPVAASTVAATGATATGAAPAGVAPTGDACAGRSRCYTTGPFMAQVTRLTASRVSWNHVLRMNVHITNLSAQPLILAYRGASGSAVDNLGNRYYYGRGGTHDVSASGIGLVIDGQADPQFALAPGESRDATFELIRYDVTKSEIGTSFTYDLALEQLELLPSRQVRSVRQYAVSFRDLSEGATRASGAAGVAGAAVTGQAQAGDAVKAARTLYDALRGKKKQPPMR